MKDNRVWWLRSKLSGIAISFFAFGIGSALLAQQPLPLSDSNRMEGDVSNQPDLPDIMSWRYIKENTEFVGHPIQELEVLNRYASPRGVQPDSMLDVEFTNREDRGFDFVVNGTFFYYDRGSEVPAGSVLRRHGFHEGLAKTDGRGGVAVLQDGSIVLGRAQGADLRAIEERFRSGSVFPTAFMGGGALVIENRDTVDSDDLQDDQDFDQIKDSAGSVVIAPPGRGGINALQFSDDHHLVIAMLSGQAYVLVNERPMTGVELQRALDDAGFETAIMFDGGSKCYYNDGGVTGFDYPNGRVNPTGFGISTPTFYVVCRQAAMRPKPAAASKPPNEWTLNDVEFSAARGELALLEIKATSLQFDPSDSDSNQTEWFVPGERIAVPVTATGTGPDGNRMTVSLAGLFEIVEVSRDKTAMLDNYPALATRLQDRTYALLEPLLRFEDPDGTTELDLQQPGANGNFRGGPIERGWSRENQNRHLEFVRQFSADPLVGQALKQQGCLIVAAYGTDDNEPIRVFRRFRDDVLQESMAGRQLIRTYYSCSPAIADGLERRPALSRAVTLGLNSLAHLLQATDTHEPGSHELVDQVPLDARILLAEVLVNGP